MPMGISGSFRQKPWKRIHGLEGNKCSDKEETGLMEGCRMLKYKGKY